MPNVMDTGCNSCFMAVYESLIEAYGPMGWWPVTPPGEVQPAYTGGPATREQRFEVAVGAILTQNTAWKNAEEAVANLNRAGLLDPDALCGIDRGRLADLVRPSGYYNQKAKRLKTVAAFFKGQKGVTRDLLLSLEGIGPETADSILLYAFNRPYFVIDAYTRRLFRRLGLIGGDERYEEIQEVFHRNMPRNVSIYKEYHALIVEHGKRFCRKKPQCNGCSISDVCGDTSGSFTEIGTQKDT